MMQLSGEIAGLDTHLAVLLRLIQEDRPRASARMIATWRRVRARCRPSAPRIIAGIFRRRGRKVTDLVMVT